MKSQRLVLALTVANLVLLLFTATRARSVSQSAGAQVLQAQTLQLVDDNGVIRSRLETKPDGTVLLQLFDQDGIIKVKLGTGRNGSGMFLADETGQSGVQIIARQTGLPDQPKTTSLTLSKSGKERLIAPCRQTKSCTGRP